MDSIREQMKALEANIEEANTIIQMQKDSIKDYKAKIKKLEKLEKEFLSIFGEVTPEDMNVVSEELPGQTELNLEAYAA